MCDIQGVATRREALGKEDMELVVSNFDEMLEHKISSSNIIFEEKNLKVCNVIVSKNNVVDSFS